MKRLCLLLVIGVLLLVGCMETTESAYSVRTVDRGTITLSLVGQWEGRDNMAVEFDSSGPLGVCLSNTYVERG